eukprot:g15198.t2
MITAGILLAAVIDHFLVHLDGGWRWAIAIQMGPAVVLLLCMPLMPKSPRWLVQQDRIDEAFVALKMVRDEVDAEMELAEIIASHRKEEDLGEPTWRDLLHGRFLVRLLHLIHWPLERSIGCCVCVSCVLCIIASDSCAYFGGKAWGKRPLILVSPRKTFEGAYCGLLGSVVMALLCDQAQHCREVSLCSFSSLALVQMWGFPSDPPMAMLTGALIFSASLLGDLVVSAMKRDARVKDTGSIIPGHGGILDRFDSYFFAAPVAYFCWQAPLFLIDL